MISGIYTAVLILLFLGIVAWAWSKQNKEKFEELSYTALQEDEELTTNNQEKIHE